MTFCLCDCRSEKALESVEKSLILISTTKHLLYSIGAFILFSLKYAFKTKKPPSELFEKINSCFIVNTLTEFLNYRFYTARKKEAVIAKFSTERLF